jgi:hypothetical protein
MFKQFKTFNLHLWFLPRDAGEDEGGGLNEAQRLNDLNHLNRSSEAKEVDHEGLELQILSGAMLLTVVFVTDS